MLERQYCESMHMDNRRYDESKELSILRGAVENTNEAFVTIDENHRVLFFNKAAEKIFGFGRHEVLGHNLDVIMTPECSNDHHLAVKRYLETRVPKKIEHDSEMTATRKGGEKFPASISFSVAEVQGKLYFTGIVRDLTETKALQDKIFRSEKLAALGQVVAEIAHEIKNPLMMIGGFAKQLIRRSSEEKTLNKLNIILNEVSRLEVLLNELGQLYQRRGLKIEKVDLKNLLDEVISLAENDFRKKHVRIDFEPDENSMLAAVDQDKLKQVFLNIFKNALEAMEHGGRLFIQTTRNQGILEIAISDDGCGIPECDEENVFAPFFTTKQNGTGLGLSISKSIIETHEGSAFNFKSEEGKGTTFFITMPLLDV